MRLEISKISIPALDYYFAVDNKGILFNKVFFIFNKSVKTYEQRCAFYLMTSIYSLTSEVYQRPQAGIIHSFLWCVTKGFTLHFAVDPNINEFGKPESIPSRRHTSPNLGEKIKLDDPYYSTKLAERAILDWEKKKKKSQSSEPWQYGVWIEKW